MIDAILQSHNPLWIIGATAAVVGGTFAATWLSLRLARRRAMKCYECGREFAPDDDEQEVCERCEREWYREHMPEALGGDLPNTRTCFDCAGVGCDYCRHTGRIPA